MARLPAPSSPWRPAAAVTLGTALLLGIAVACTEYQAYDSVGFVQEVYRSQAVGAQVPDLAVPFELDDELRAVVHDRIRPTPDEEFRVEQILDLIFRQWGLRYSLFPTRDAAGTHRARRGNCLSFVNLFVGIAREVRLNPFYVEVTDFQRWNYRHGMVVSQGHIIAGLTLKGELHTFDFLPGRPKTYRTFHPIDDVTATAHYYNNLAAEALMAGDAESALELTVVATTLAPEFDKALNNHGVSLARLGRRQEALEVYQKALEISADDAAVLTNLARLHQELGNHDEVASILDRLDASQHVHPFFLLYRGDQALAQGDLQEGLEYMRRAYQRDAEIPEVHVGLIRAYMALGDLPRARHHLSRALRLDATHEEALAFARMLHGK